MTALTKPLKPTAAYKAAQLIYEEGPMPKAALFAKVDFGVAADIRNGTLRRAIDAGWLDVNEAGYVDVTFEALALLEQEARRQKPEPTGSVATPRECNVYKRKPYSPPKRFVRDDVPAWSRYPDGFRLYTIA